MNLLNTSSKRIAGTFALVQALLVAGALLFVQWQADRAVISNAMEENREALEAMTQIATRNGLDAVLAEIAAQAQPEHRAKVIALRQADGRILAGNLEVWPDSLGPNMRWQVMTIRLKGAQTADEVGLSTRRISGGVIILHGSVLSTHRSISVAVKTAFSWVFLLTVLLSVASAFLFSRFLDRRIEQFAWAADAVSRGDLSRRIDRRPTNDAFDHLANSINGMLDNIERLVGELRGVTDMLAHDLRSPLSRLSLKLERGVTRTEDPEAVTALAAAQQEAGILQRTLDTALQISRAEGGVDKRDFADFDLAELLEDIADLYQLALEEKGVDLRLDCPQALKLLGHRDLVQQAIGNLIDNAFKYASQGRFIEIAARQIETGIVIEVTDDGPGILPEFRAEAMRRFARLGKARTEPGAGLGLALVDSVVRMHEGTVTLSDGPQGGLRVTLFFPALSDT